MIWFIIIGIAISCFRTRPHTYFQSRSSSSSKQKRSHLIQFEKKRQTHCISNKLWLFMKKRFWDKHLLAPFLNHHTSCIQVSTVVAVLLSTTYRVINLLCLKKKHLAQKKLVCKNSPIWKMNNSVTTIRGTASFFSRFQTHYYSVVTYLWKLRTFSIYLQL